MDIFSRVEVRETIASCYPQKGVPRGYGLLLGRLEPSPWTGFEEAIIRSSSSRNARQLIQLVELHPSESE